MTLEKTARKVKDVVASILKTLECAICLDTLQDPVSTNCRHTFCKACITRVLSSTYQAPCPLCKAPVTRRSLNQKGQLKDVILTAKKLAVAVREDTGLEVTPPKGPMVSIVSPESRKINMKQFHLAHPSPFKIVGKQRLSNNLLSKTLAVNTSSDDTRENTKRKRTIIHLDADASMGNEITQPHISTNINIHCGFPMPRKRMKKIYSDIESSDGYSSDSTVKSISADKKKIRKNCKPLLLHRRSWSLTSGNKPQHSRSLLNEPDDDYCRQLKNYLETSPFCAETSRQAQERSKSTGSVRKKQTDGKCTAGQIWYDRDSMNKTLPAHKDYSRHKLNEEQMSKSDSEVETVAKIQEWLMNCEDSKSSEAGGQSIENNSSINCLVDKALTEVSSDENQPCTENNLFAKKSNLYPLPLKSKENTRNINEKKYASRIFKKSVVNVEDKCHQDKDVSEEDPYLFISSQKTPKKIKKKRGGQKKKISNVVIQQSSLHSDNRENIRSSMDDFVCPKKYAGEPTLITEMEVSNKIEHISTSDSILSKPTACSETFRVHSGAECIQIAEKNSAADNDDHISSTYHRVINYDDDDDDLLFVTPAFDTNEMFMKKKKMMKNPTMNPLEELPKVVKSHKKSIVKDKVHLFSEEGNILSTQEQVSELTRKISEAETFELDIDQGTDKCKETLPVCYERKCSKNACQASIEEGFVNEQGNLSDCVSNKENDKIYVEEKISENVVGTVGSQELQLTDEKYVVKNSENVTQTIGSQNVKLTSDKLIEKKSENVIGHDTDQNLQLTDENNTDTMNEVTNYTEVFRVVKKLDTSLIKSHLKEISEDFQYRKLSPLKIESGHVVNQINMVKDENTSQNACDISLFNAEHAASIVVSNEKETNKFSPKTNVEIVQNEHLKEQVKQSEPENYCSPVEIISSEIEGQGINERNLDGLKKINSDSCLGKNLDFGANQDNGEGEKYRATREENTECISECHNSVKAHTNPDHLPYANQMDISVLSQHTSKFDNSSNKKTLTDNPQCFIETADELLSDVSNIAQSIPETVISGNSSAVYKQSGILHSSATNHTDAQFNKQISSGSQFIVNENTSHDAKAKPSSVEQKVENTELDSGTLQDEVSTKATLNCANTADSIEHSSPEELSLKDMEKYFKKSTRKTFSIEVETQDMEVLGSSKNSTLDVLDEVCSISKSEERNTGQSVEGKAVSKITPCCSDTSDIGPKGNFDMKSSLIYKLTLSSEENGDKSHVGEKDQLMECDEEDAVCHANLETKPSEDIPHTFEQNNVAFSDKNCTILDCTMNDKLDTEEQSICNTKTLMSTTAEMVNNSPAEMSSNDIGKIKCPLVVHNNLNPNFSLCTCGKANCICSSSPTKGPDLKNIQLYDNNNAQGNMLDIYDSDELPNDGKGFERNFKRTKNSSLVIENFKCKFKNDESGSEQAVPQINLNFTTHSDNEVQFSNRSDEEDLECHSKFKKDVVRMQTSSDTVVTQPLHTICEVSQDKINLGLDDENSEESCKLHKTCLAGKANSEIECGKLTDLTTFSISIEKLLTRTKKSSETLCILPCICFGCKIELSVNDGTLHLSVSKAENEHQQTATKDMHITQDQTASSGVNDLPEINSFTIQNAKLYPNIASRSSFETHKKDSNLSRNVDLSDDYNLHIDNENIPSKAIISEDCVDIRSKPFVELEYCNNAISEVNLSDSGDSVSVFTPFSKQLDPGVDKDMHRQDVYSNKTAHNLNKHSFPSASNSHGENIEIALNTTSSVPAVKLSCDSKMDNADLATDSIISPTNQQNADKQVKDDYQDLSCTNERNKIVSIHNSPDITKNLNVINVSSDSDILDNELDDEEGYTSEEIDPFLYRQGKTKPVNTNVVCDDIDDDFIVENSNNYSSDPDMLFAESLVAPLKDPIVNNDSARNDISISCTAHSMKRSSGCRSTSEQNANKKFESYNLKNDVNLPNPTNNKFFSELHQKSDIMSASTNSFVVQKPSQKSTPQGGTSSSSLKKCRKFRRIQQLHSSEESDTDDSCDLSVLKSPVRDPCELQPLLIEEEVNNKHLNPNICKSKDEKTDQVITLGDSLSLVGSNNDVHNTPNAMSRVLANIEEDLRCGKSQSINLDQSYQCGRLKEEYKNEENLPNTQCSFISHAAANDISCSSVWSSQDVQPTQARQKIQVEIDEMKERIRQMEFQLRKSAGDVLNSSRLSVKKAIKKESQSSRKYSTPVKEESSEESDDLFTPPISPTPPAGKRSRKEVVSFRRHL